MRADEDGVAARTKVMVITSDVDLRSRLAAALDQQTDIQVVGTAVNGRTGAIKALSYGPEVVVAEVVREFDPALLRTMQRRLVPFTGDLEWARGHGFGDALLRPEARQGASFDAFVGELCRRVNGARPRVAASEAAGQCELGATGPAPQPPQLPVPSLFKLSPKVVGIGVSTGGPAALATLLSRLPADFAVPVLIVQHMPPNFTASLAESLDRICALRVREAQQGMAVRAGEVLLAPGGRHMRVVDTALGVQVKITDDPPECSCRPSVDYLFRSLGEVYGARTLAVVMTGMGEDGLAASRQLARIGATLLAQDKETCTVFGMPRGLVEERLADQVLPLHKIADAITGRTTALGVR